MGIATDIVILVVAGFLGGFLAFAAHQPLVVGYILAGVALGPHSLGLILEADLPQIELLAEIGVALLLFALGLEFSLKEIKLVQKVALVGGALQIGFTCLAGFGLGRLLGWEFKEALWFGALISFSSTMVVLKTLMARGLMGTLSARVMLGILMVQDLAVVPFMIVLPQLGQEHLDWSALGLALLKGAAFLLVMILLGSRLLPWLLSRIAGWHSRELFLLAITGLGLGIGALSHLVGLSFALGAFMVGMVLSESDFGHQALGEIVPLRDIFGLIFFTSAGMLLDPAFVWSHGGLILGLLFLVFVVKAALLGGLVRAFGYGNIIPLATGLTLFQVGEFSFVLARKGLETGQIGAELYGLVLAVTVLGMALTPLVSSLARPLQAFAQRQSQKETFTSINLREEKLKDHLVLIGGGRIGRQVARMLLEYHLPLVIIELNYQHVQACKKEGLPVIYGDATQAVVLEAAHLEKASLVLITFWELVSLLGLIKQIQSLCPQVPMVAPAVGQAQWKALHQAGVHRVVLPEFETGMELCRQALEHQGIPLTQIHDSVEKAHQAWIQPQEDQHQQQPLLTKLRHARDLIDLAWSSLPKGHALENLSLRQSGIREATGATLVGVLRGREFFQNPGADFCFQAGDLLAAIGGEAERQAFKDLLQPESPEEEPRG